MRLSIGLWVLASISGALAACIDRAPRVRIADGTVIGFSNNSIDTFQGIPYADPPIGELRFKTPRPLSSPFGIFNANSTPRSCPPHPIVTDPNIFKLLPPPLSDAVNGYFHTPTIVSEDCLNLAVQRPSSTASNAKLPVLVWIYGGSFQFGSYEDYDYSPMITKSVALGHPIIVVRMQYRTGTWGFLAGKDLQEEGSTNVGLKDQRLALQWVADNIAAFGGDPDKITIWGESAGSMSVFYQTIAYSGDNTYRGRKLFRGAIMNSGSALPGQAVGSQTSQGYYDSLVTAAGCDGAADGSLSCLRQVPYDRLYNATAAIPGMFSPDGLRMSFVPRTDPKDTFLPSSTFDLLKAQKIAQVPVLSGTQDDEGTLFGLSMLNSTNSTTLTKALHDLYPVVSSDVFESVLNVYPDQPSLGSPFDTGNANQLYQGYKRNAAIVGDLAFHFQKRAFHEAVASKLKIWNFNSKYGKATPFLGTFHGSDLGLMSSGQPSVPYQAILQYYISFINFLDPNKLGQNGEVPNWPQWDTNGKKMMEFRDNATSVVTDNARQEAYEYFVKVQDKFLL
ncbi:unnamed protein product [Clonostachys rosea]|uniref:Carboxylic ester hydrolase n=1 Tax=Bionectria ochroleuca TaxID=29856 RepID=A0ABY6UHN9_BIOOC|nr:unnamed protein product [Clonostachys rosea]